MYWQQIIGKEKIHNTISDSIKTQKHLTKYMHCYLRQQLNHKDIMVSKKAKHKRLYIIWFYIYETLEYAKLIYNHNF